MCDPLVLAARPLVLQQHIESFAHDVGGAPDLGGGKIFQPLAPKDELVVYPKSNLTSLAPRRHQNRGVLGIFAGGNVFALEVAFPTRRAFNHADSVLSLAASP